MIDYLNSLRLPRRENLDHGRLPRQRLENLAHDKVAKRPLSWVSIHKSA